MNIESLRAAIILRALADYENLLFHRVGRLDECGQTIRKEEIEDFFNSEWSDFLLSPYEMTGKELFNLMVGKWSNGNRYFIKNKEPISKEVKRKNAEVRKSRH